MFDDDEPDDPAAWIKESIFLPQFRERLQDGSLGPAYGPDTDRAWEYALKLFRESIHSIGGGGLWDPEAAASAGTLKKRITHARERHDAADALRFLHAHGSSMPAREAAAVRAFFDGKSYGAIARSMAVKESSVREFLRRFRRRVAASCVEPRKRPHQGMGDPVE